MTRTARDGRTLERVWRTNLLPARDHPAWRPIPSAPDPSAPSYWVDRGGVAMQRADFELALDDAETIGRTLDARWRGGPFEGLGRRLAGLTGRFRAREERAEVSENVYEMF